MPKILIPSPLRKFTGNAAEVVVAGGTVGEALKSLAELHPELHQQIFTAEGKIRSFVNVYHNDEDIRFLDKEATVTADGDIVTLVPSIAGGSQVVTAALSNEELERYSRHLILPEVGVEGQLKLKASKVLLVGTGGLGSPLALYLAAAGVGTLGLVDFDIVDYSNLQRQVIHGTSDIGRKKLDSAEDSIRELNPNVRVVRHDGALTSENALGIIKDYDVVADGTDNFPTRYLVNDACVLLGKPNAYGSIFRFDGQASVFAYEDGPCYRCLYPEPPPPGMVPSCAEGGVLGILPGVVGLIQATEVVKLVLGIGETLKGRLLLYDALNMRFRELKLRRNPECPVCGDHRTITKLIDYQEFCGMPKTNAPLESGEILPEDVMAMIARGDDFTLLDVREPHEHQVRNIPQARLIPLGTLPAQLGSLDASKQIVVHCKGGMRSAQACTLLREKGFRNVLNVKGGIDAWKV